MSQPSSSPPVPISAQRLEAYTILIQKLSCYLVCLFAVLLWDFLVTFHDEVMYIWLSPPPSPTLSQRNWTWRWFKNKVNLVKVAYAVNRYLTLAFMAFVVVCIKSEQVVRVCDRIHLLQPILPIIIFFSSNFLFIKRCSALFSSRSRLVFWLLLSLAAIQAVVQVVCSLKNRPVPLPPGTVGCFSNPSCQNQEFSFIYWVLPLITQSITFLLTVYKVLRRWHITGRSKLFRAFLRDGVQYFAVVTSANLVNIVYMRSKIRYNGVEFRGGSFNAAMATVMTSMMVSRLIIHMRKKARRQALLPQLKEEDVHPPKLEIIELRKAGSVKQPDDDAWIVTEQQQPEEGVSQMPLCLYK